MEWFEAGRTKIYCFERIFEELDLRENYYWRTAIYLDHIIKRETNGRRLENFRGLSADIDRYLLDLAILYTDRFYRLLLRCTVGSRSHRVHASGASFAHILAFITAKGPYKVLI